MVDSFYIIGLATEFTRSESLAPLIAPLHFPCVGWVHKANQGDESQGRPQLSPANVSHNLKHSL
ncbi:MAG: hypothetical protein IJ209_02090 [Bacteroidaceae bacterium]|nr:hypothetical protein [Bacteroidaceae bacterium]